jgi:hypothetical protein
LDSKRDTETKSKKRQVKRRHTRKRQHELEQAAKQDPYAAEELEDEDYE